MSRIGTVSTVLNRPELVAPATRQRVLDVIAELGYVRNDSARALRAGHSRTIAVVVLDVANPFFTDVVRGVEAATDGSGSMVIICNSGDDAARERRHLDQLEEQRVRGVLITPVDRTADDRLQRLDPPRHPGRPGRPRGRHAHRCSVAVDDVLGGRLAAEHLVGLRPPATRVRRRADQHPHRSPTGYAGASAVVAGDRRGAASRLRTPALNAEYGRNAGQQIADLPAA